MNEDDKLLYEEAKNALNVDNLKDLAELLGYAKTSSNNWYKSGFSEIVRMKIRDKIDENSKNTIQNPPSNTNEKYESSTIKLPLVTNVRARGGSGNGLDGIDSFEVVDTMVISRTFLKTPPTGTIRVIGVEGYSMVPMLYPDTFVIFDENPEWRGDGLYILNWRNDLMVKLLQIDPYGRLHIKSANKDYESWTVDPDDQSIFEIVGKVLRIIL